MGFYLHPALVAEIKNSYSGFTSVLNVSTKYRLTGTDCVGRAGQWQSRNSGQFCRNAAVFS